MTATEELRKLLDERGVKWWPMRNNGYYEDRETEFVVNGKKHTAHEWGDGFAVYSLTPEQAIAATLGSAVNPDGLQAGLIISDDGELLNWRGENYVKQATLNEVADKWAEAQIEAEDCARRNMLLESLVRDWYELYEDPDYGDYCRLTYRMRVLGIEVNDE